MNLVISETKLAKAEMHSSNLIIYERILILLFLLSLPLSNPWVRGDGVGYYAFGRSLLVEGNLDFKKDWNAANSSFRLGRVNSDGKINQSQFTVTNHLDNHFTIGPAMLWSPFLVIAHVAVKISHVFGSRVDADGFSLPYRIAMALGTALYGFLGLWFSFQLARKYCGEKWAFVGVLGIWFASSLPVYMYFNPSWSHAHSAFAVALLLWYWDRTREARSTTQWIIFGVIAGLMIDVYYVNAVLLVVPLLETLAKFWKGFKSREFDRVERLLISNAIFVITLLVAITPTLITKKIIYGSYFNLGYTERWFWGSPALLSVCFSSEHGLFSWTPVLALSVAGLFLLRRYDRDLSLFLICIFVLYLYTIGCYQDWAGISSFGNRFFVSLTPLFVIGLASFFSYVASRWRERTSATFAWSATAILAVWNMGLIFQWGTHLIPARGPISWRNAAYNQVKVVPVQAVLTLKNYIVGRHELMDHIEEQDVKQLRNHGQ